MGAAHGPQRVMGNYFRQIYTGSHAEWWTTVFDPHGQAGEGLVAFFFLELARVSLDCSGRGVGLARRKAMEGSWWREGKVGLLIGGAARGQPPLLG